MKIGFVGIGIMGAPMALNLIKAGHELHIFSRSGKRCETLIAEGAVREESPAAVASGCDVFISIVSDTPDVEEVLFGDNGASRTLRPDTVAIDMSTISPKSTADFAARLALKRVSLLDAPVSGGDKGAINGTLSIMVGGDRNAFDRCFPIFQAMGKTIVYAGPSGYGQKTKLVNQVVGALNLLATVEGLRLAKTSGLDLKTTLEAVGSGRRELLAVEQSWSEGRGGRHGPGLYDQVAAERYASGARIVAGARAQCARHAAHFRPVYKGIADGLWRAGHSGPDSSLGVSHAVRCFPDRFTDMLRC